MSKIKQVASSDILHKTTYVWKEDSGCGIVIKNDGNKVILNPKTTAIWKLINDEDSIKQIIEAVNIVDREEGLKIIEDLLEANLVTNEDFVWGDDLL